MVRFGEKGQRGRSSRGPDMLRSTLNGGKEEGNRGRKEQEEEGILDDDFPPRLGAFEPMKQEPRNKMQSEGNSDTCRTWKGLAVKVPQSSPQSFTKDWIRPGPSTCIGR